jgi:chaperonin GroES
VINPINDRVIVKPIELTNVTEDGFIVSESGSGLITGRKENAPKPQEGVVLACGPGKPLDHPVYDPQQNKLIWHHPMPVRVGDLISYSKYGGTEVTIDGIDVIVLSNLEAVIGVFGDDMLHEEVESIASK